MSKLLKTITFIFFVLVTACGYQPLLNSEKINFYLSEINFEGDKQINNFISNNLEKYKKKKDNLKEYKVKIVSNYNKNIVNKDDSGNPKNYNLEITLNVLIISDEDKQINRILKRNIPLSSQDKKIKEIELEKQYKKNISNLLIQDLVFLLINK